MQGAIYVTDNAAYTWKAAVQETVDATLNRTVSSGEHFCSTPGVIDLMNNDLLTACTKLHQSMHHTLSQLLRRLYISNLRWSGCLIEEL